MWLEFQAPLLKGAGEMRSKAKMYGGGHIWGTLVYQSKTAAVSVATPF